MRIIIRLNGQAGFTLIQAIFILLVLALLGVAMMRLSGMQSRTGTFALQGARAYQAARSGVEWGAARVSAGNACNGSMTLDGFAVTVSCSSSVYTEAGVNITVHQLNAVATFGNYGSPDFVSRRIEMKMAM